jgi:hypothetical protein
MEIRDLGDVRRGYILGVSIVTRGMLTPRLVFADTCLEMGLSVSTFACL